MCSEEGPGAPRLFSPCPWQRFAERSLRTAPVPRCSGSLCRQLCSSSPRLRQPLGSPPPPAWPGLHRQLQGCCVCETVLIEPKHHSICFELNGGGLQKVLNGLKQTNCGCARKKVCTPANLESGNQGLV